MYFHLAIFTFAIFLVINIKYYTLNQCLISSFFQLTTIVSFLALFADGMVAAPLVLILAYFQHLRINRINLVIEKISKLRFPTSTAINLAIVRFNREHNHFVSQIWSFNNYWENLYLLFVVTAFPINLFSMHQIIFERIELFLRLFFVILLLFHDMIFFGLQLSLASFSKKIHKMGSNLSRLQWKVNGNPYRMRTKLKLLITFEKLSSKKKLGISLGYVIMTFPLFYKVSSIIFS